jgi:hypothetical protein
MWRDCSGGNDHFRTPSLIGLTSLSPSAGIDEVGVPDKNTPSIQTHDRILAPPISPSSSAFSDTDTWQGVHDSVMYSSSDVHIDTPAEKKNRKSHTIRMRTSHWNKGRFEATLLSAPRKENSADLARPSTPVPQRLANEFGDVISLLRSEASIPADDELVSSSPVALHQEKKRQQRGFVAFVLELWLWLQFAIVVVVFLWAMAKRGPKSVLEETQRRKIR